QVTVLALENALGHQTIDVLSRDLQTKVEKISEQQRRILALQSQLRRRVVDGSVDGGRWTVDGKKEADPSTVHRPPSTDPSTVHRPPSTSPLAPGIIGSSPQLQQVLGLIRTVAANDTTV